MNNIIPFKSYIKKLKHEYISKSLKSSSKIIDYISKIKILNKQTGEITKLSYDFMKIQKNNYLWYNFVSNYLQNYAVVNNLNAVFVTLTLPPEYHKYKTLKNGSHVYNKSYSGYSINDGYKLLNQSFRYLTNDFRINRKKQKIKYLKVIEPHKDFTPHLHAIIFLDDIQLSHFYNHFKNTIELKSIGSEFDYTVLDSVQASVAYIMKYVKKSVYSNNSVDSRFVDGWKKDNKIRMFTCSNIPVSREIYRIVSRYVDLSSDSDNYSILNNLEKKVCVKIEYYSSGKLYKSKTLFNKKSDSFLIIKKNKKVHYDFKDFILNLDFFKKEQMYLDYINLVKYLDSIEFDYKSLHDYYYDYDLLDDFIYYISYDYDYKSFIYTIPVDILYDTLLNYAYDVLFNKKSVYSTFFTSLNVKGLEVYNSDFFSLF